MAAKWAKIILGIAALFIFLHFIAITLSIPYYVFDPVGDFGQRINTSRYLIDFVFWLIPSFVIILLCWSPIKRSQYSIFIFSAVLALSLSWLSAIVPGSAVGYQQRFGFPFRHDAVTFASTAYDTRKVDRQKTNYSGGLPYPFYANVSVYDADNKRIGGSKYMLANSYIFDFLFWLILGFVVLRIIQFFTEKAEG